MKSSCLAGVFLLFTAFGVNAQSSFQKMYPVNFSEVNITDAFWKPKMETVATATLDACVSYTQDKTGRIRNFEKAASSLKEPRAP